MEQRNHPEGVGGLYPQTAEGTTESPRDGGETEEAGEHQPLPAPPHTGEGGRGGHQPLPAAPHTSEGGGGESFPDLFFVCFLFCRSWSFRLASRPSLPPPRPHLFPPRRPPLWTPRPCSPPRCLTPSPPPPPWRPPLWVWMP